MNPGSLLFQLVRRKTLRIAGWLFGLALLPAMAAAQTSFGPVGLGSSANATVTLTIASAGTLSSIAVLTQGAPSFDFTNAGGGTCSTGTAYSATATCTVKVTFAPKYAGARYGAVVLQSTGGVLATAYLQGTGGASRTPQASFFRDSKAASEAGLSARRALRSMPAEMSISATQALRRRLYTRRPFRTGPTRRRPSAAASLIQTA